MRHRIRLFVLPDLPMTPSPYHLQPLRSISCASRTASATSRIDLRVSMLVLRIRWNASASRSPWVSIRTPLARSTTLRVSSASRRSPTSRSSARNSSKRASAELDDRQQLRFAEWLDHVADDAGFARPLDQCLVGVRGQQHHRRDLSPASAPRRTAMPSSSGILMSMMTISGCSLRESSSAAPAITGLADHVIAKLSQHLAQVEPDQRLVIGDQHAPRAGGAGDSLMGGVLNVSGRHDDRATTALARRTSTAMRTG